MDLVLSNFLKDYMVSEDDLLSSFGTSNYSDYGDNTGVKNKSTLKKAPGIDVKPFADLASEMKGVKDVLSNTEDAEKALDEQTFKDKLGKGIGVAAQAAPVALDMISNLKGDKWDTSAHGGGVGSATGAMVTSGAQAAMTGAKIAGPWGAAVGGVLGAGTALIGNKKAKQEYRQNRKEYNIAESAIEKAKREEEYRYSKGLEMINDLKSLREKQLGFLM